jgi:hypothetical protein
LALPGAFAPLQKKREIVRPVDVDTRVASNQPSDLTRPRASAQRPNFNTLLGEMPSHFRSDHSRSSPRQEDRAIGDVQCGALAGYGPAAQLGFSMSVDGAIHWDSCDNIEPFRIVALENLMQLDL